MRAVFSLPICSSKTVHRNIDNDVWIPVLFFGPFCDRPKQCFRDFLVLLCLVDNSIIEFYEAGSLFGEVACKPS